MVSPRYLHDKLIAHLDEGGLLHPLLQRVKLDRTLMLAPRGQALNIYYRGGNLLRLELEPGESGAWLQAHFDANYASPTLALPPRPAQIHGPADVDAWLAAFPNLKLAIDIKIGAGKAEREFQQVVVRENNDSNISNETEYFITDIELADQDARFDMLGIKWPRSQRRSPEKCQLALFEMKYGDSALAGHSSLVKHLDDLNRILGNRENVKGLRESTQRVFTQLTRLGLITVHQSKEITISDEPPEVIFILANHHPGSKVLATALEGVRERIKPELYRLRFFVSSFAGYALHQACMLDLDAFETLVQQLHARAK